MVGCGCSDRAPATARPLLAFPASPSVLAHAQMPASPQYSEHVEWLRTLRAQYERQVVNFERTPSSCPVGFSGAPPSPSRSASVDIHGAGALPEAPMAWGQRFADEEEIFLGGNGIADLTIADSDFDEPVYRSLGSMFDGVEFVQDDHAFEEEPVYRSIGDAFASVAQDEGLDEESESRWLQKMPPLIRRQKAANFAPVLAELGM